METSGHNRTKHEPHSINSFQFERDFFVIFVGPMSGPHQTIQYVKGWRLDGKELAHSPRNET